MKPLPLCPINLKRRIEVELTPAIRAGMRVTDQGRKRLLKLDNAAKHMPWAKRFGMIEAKYKQYLKDGEK